MLASPTGPLILNDLDPIVQGQSLAGHISGTYKCSYLDLTSSSYLAQAISRGTFGTEGHFSKPYRSTNFEWPWPNCSKVNLWQAISREPFDLQPSYMAQADKLTSFISSISLSDLEQLGQGQSLAGNISWTVWPTTCTFGTEGHASKLLG